MERIIDVYYDRLGYPFKDRELTARFPVVGSEFLGASQTTTIRFHYEQIGTDENVYTVESKRPDGKTGSQLLSKNTTEHYAEMSLSGWYSECKGDLFLSLKVYRGGTTATYNETTQLWEVSGVPVIESTGAIKLAINYTPMGRYENYNDAISTYQDVLAALGDKLDTIKGIVGVSGLSQVDTTEYEEGQLFFDVDTKNIYKLESGEFVKINNKLEIVDVSGQTYQALLDKYGTQPFMSYFGETNNISVYQFKEITGGYELHCSSQKNGLVHIPSVVLTNTFSTSDFTQLDFQSAPVVVLTNEVGTLSDLDFEKLLQPNASLKLGDLYFIKAYEDDTIIEFWHYNVGNISSNSYVGYHNISISKQNKYYRLGSVEELFYDKTKTDQLLNAKQNELHSGTNIKTINNIPLLGSGNIDIQGGSGNAEWGSIGGDIADQTDLQNELQDIREVAEGKCKTYVLNASTETVNSDFYDRYSRFVDEEIIPFESKQEMDDWLSEERRAVINPVFARQDDFIALQIAGTNQNANYFDYFVVSSQNISPYPTTREFILITLSDVIYEQVAFKLGDNLYITSTKYPDRWVSLVYRSPNPGPGIIPGGVRFHALETSKVNLDNYSTKSETSTEVNKVAHDIAVEYDENTLYGSGDLCIKDKLLYKCNTDNTTGTWDSTKWDLTTVNSELGIIKGDYVTLASDQTISGNKNHTGALQKNGVDVATTDQAFKIIEASEIGTGNKLTQAQYNLIIAAPRSLPVLIRGNLAGNYDTMLCGMAVSGQGVNGIAINGRNIHSFHIDAYTRVFTFDSSDANDYLQIKGTNVNDIINGTFNVINASDIASNNQLTPEQYDLINNGKPTLIKGQKVSMWNPILGVPTTYGGMLQGIIIGNSQNPKIAHYTIDTTTRVLSLASGQGIYLANIGNLNGKIIPPYPTSNATPRYLQIGANGGGLSFVDPFTPTSVSISDGETISDNTLKGLIQNEQPIKLNGFTCYFSCDDGTNYQYVSTRYDATANKNHINVITINKTTWVATFHTSDIAV